MSRELANAGTNATRYAFEIADPADNLLMEVPFMEVLDRRRWPALPSSAARLRKAAAEVERTAHLITSIGE
jgi:hypothetical protein